jgi:hypothetical protein
MKKASKKTLKKAAWKAFARFIKARDARKDGTCVCCTCNAILTWSNSNCQAGHFVCGRGNAVLFDEDVVHAQCSICNLNDGEGYLYGLFMKRKYGYDDKKLVELNDRKFRVMKYSEEDYRRIAEEYSNKSDALIALKGL